MIDWNSKDSHWLLNPKLSDQEKDLAEAAKRAAPSISGSIWIRSSGTTALGSTRWVCLSKKGFLIAAHAANEHLKSQPGDIWLRCLPEFHVGGLAILARCFLSGARVVSLEKWSPADFLKAVETHQVTLSSLVPTQVFDLVKAKLTSPRSLRAIVVGGDALNPNLYKQARQLGWPLLPSYGLTEMGSQVATAPLSSLSRVEEFPQLELLSHVAARVDGEQRLVLQSDALFLGELHVLSTGAVTWTARAPQSEYTTLDQVQLNGRSLVFLGRSEDSVKILGEFVSMRKLRELWQRLAVESGISPHGAVLLARPCSRKGNEIVVAGELASLKLFQGATAQFNAKVEKYENIQGLYFLDRLPLTELGKTKIAELKSLIS